ncbi:glycosyltransferase [Salinibacterium sp. G-O1]|uniref:glycosyltransferase n=1 Tax=Salinibacterium sp. G-O1 TaxID=3046208 RepID=UPI0024B9C611|nr:glycosyltransferase [Salinibacterium sp. G-O1]MDJ0333803.1 glycosyltransferase [Salinibacterium sp. G-O1]
MTQVAELVVLIPARDEEALIARCLESVLAARANVDIPVTVVVAADGCLDATAEIARSFDGVVVVEIDSSNVGTARGIAARTALELIACDPGRVWMANTDADSVVPPNWLSEQVRLANSGVDVMIGTVRPEFDELSVEQERAWRARHVPGQPNGHVHGANLGVRASTYLEAGGYEALPEHEDVDLVARLKAVSRVVASDDCEVVTSGRKFGRTPGGYARYLREDLLYAAEGMEAPVA